jgi:hypothetical protein
MNADKRVQRDRQCHHANQPAAPKSLSAFICVHPRLNPLAFAPTSQATPSAGAATSRSRPGNPPAPPAPSPATAVQILPPQPIRPERQTIVAPAPTYPARRCTLQGGAAPPAAPVPHDQAPTTKCVLPAATPYAQRTARGAPPSAPDNSRLSPSPADHAIPTHATTASASPPQRPQGAHRPDPPRHLARPHPDHEMHCARRNAYAQRAVLRAPPIGRRQRPISAHQPAPPGRLPAVTCIDARASAPAPPDHPQGNRQRRSPTALTTPTFPIPRALV